MDILYRLSTNGYAKTKFSSATKERCLLSAIHEFGADNIHLFVDKTNLTAEGTNTIAKYTTKYGFKSIVWHDGGSSAGSWRVVFNYAIDKSDSTLIYFLEDDYLHAAGSRKLFEEGLAIADYVSLYDHNDKYIPGTEGGNPFIMQDCGEETKVFVTKSIHWKLTNSTTMTFATSVEQLRKDRDIWERHTLSNHPNDFAAFLELRKEGRSLITCLPGFSTHCEPMWAAPLRDWNALAASY